MTPHERDMVDAQEHGLAVGLLRGLTWNISSMNADFRARAGAYLAWKDFLFYVAYWWTNS